MTSDSFFRIIRDNGEKTDLLGKKIKWEIFEKAVRHDSDLKYFSGLVSWCGESIVKWGETIRLPGWWQNGRQGAQQAVT
jgi:hypothetical protein